MQPPIEETLDLSNPAKVQPNEYPGAKKEEPSEVSSTSKLQAQIMSAEGQQSMLQLEHDHLGQDYSINVKMINPNPFDSAPSFRPGGSSATGIYVLQYLQSVSKNLSLGAEYLLQRPTPDLQESTLSFAARHCLYADNVPQPSVLPAGMPSPYHPVNPKDPVQVLSTTYQPSAGLFHSTFYRKINTRLDLAAELQMLLQPGRGKYQYGRREAVASIGFKIDTVFATVRAMIDTQGKVSTVIEERLGQGLSFQVRMNYRPFVKLFT